MANLSETGNLIVQLAKGLFEDPEGKDRNQIRYKVDFKDTRSSNSASMQITYTLKKPITEEELDADFDRMFKKIAAETGNVGADIIGSVLFSRAGFTKEDIKLSSKQGITTVKFDSTSDIAAEETAGANVGVQLVKGRFVSRGTLRDMLELLMRENMLSTMTKPSAGTGRNTPLRNRTGRFLSSAEVSSVNVINQRVAGKVQSQKLSLYYKYMIYPYQVFDPVNTQSPQKNLASRARNPQKIIGDALARAAKTLVGNRYSISIQQVI